MEMLVIVGNDEVKPKPRMVKAPPPMEPTIKVAVALEILTEPVVTLFSQLSAVVRSCENPFPVGAANVVGKAPVQLLRYET